jgi:hypothetical protein
LAEEKNMKKLTIALLPLILLTASCSDQKKIDYHISKYEQIGSTITGVPTGKQWTEIKKQQLIHLNALVALGELEKQTFKLEYVPRDSKRESEFEHEISTRFQRDPIFPIYSNQVLRTNATAQAEHSITVWDTPEQMIKWAEFIEEFDVPQNK